LKMATRIDPPRAGQTLPDTSPSPAKVNGLKFRESSCACPEEFKVASCTDRSTMSATTSVSPSLFPHIMGSIFYSSSWVDIWQVHQSMTEDIVCAMQRLSPLRSSSWQSDLMIYTWLMSSCSRLRTRIRTNYTLSFDGVDKNAKAGRNCAYAIILGHRHRSAKMVPISHQHFLTVSDACFKFLFGRSLRTTERESGDCLTECITGAACPKRAPVLLVAWDTVCNAIWMLVEHW
jgi:hypothetical protein